MKTYNILLIEGHRAKPQDITPDGYLKSWEDPTKRAEYTRGEAIKKNAGFKGKLVECKSEPTIKPQNQSKKVDALLLALVEIQESIESELDTKEIAWMNETYDHVKACFYGESDGDRQQEYFDSGEALTEEEAIKEILVRIKNSLNYWN